MTVVKGFLIILLSAAAFGLGGGLIGYILGVWTPSYYRGVFISGREPWFDPVAVGLGLGVSQGLMCGVVAGVAVVLAVAWYKARRGFDGEPLPDQPPRGTVPAARLSEEEGIRRLPGR